MWIFIAITPCQTPYLRNGLLCLLTHFPSSHQALSQLVPHGFQMHKSMFMNLLKSFPCLLIAHWIKHRLHSLDFGNLHSVFLNYLPNTESYTLSLHCSQTQASSLFLGYIPCPSMFLSFFRVLPPHGVSTYWPDFEALSQIIFLHPSSFPDPPTGFAFFLLCLLHSPFFIASYHFSSLFFFLQIIYTPLYFHVSWFYKKSLRTRRSSRSQPSFL